MGVCYLGLSSHRPLLSLVFQRPGIVFSALKPSLDGIGQVNSPCAFFPWIYQQSGELVLMQAMQAHSCHPKQQARHHVEEAEGICCLFTRGKRKRKRKRTYLPFGVSCVGRVRRGGVPVCIAVGDLSCQASRIV